MSQLRCSLGFQVAPSTWTSLLRPASEESSSSSAVGNHSTDSDSSGLVIYAHSQVYSPGGEPNGEASAGPYTIRRMTQPAEKPCSPADRDLLNTFSQVSSASYKGIPKIHDAEDSTTLENPALIAANTDDRWPSRRSVYQPVDYYGLILAQNDTTSSVVASDSTTPGTSTSLVPLQDLLSEEARHPGVFTSVTNWFSRKTVSERGNLPGSPTGSLPGGHMGSTTRSSRQPLLPLYGFVAARYQTLVILNAVQSSLLFGYTIALPNTLGSNLEVTFGWCDDIATECPRATRNLAMINAVAFLGAMLGSFGCGWVLSGCHLRWLAGRKGALLLSNALFICGGIQGLFATGLGTLVASRFMSGLGMGLVTVATPLYITEMTTTSSRGTYGALHQIFIALGILIVLLMGFPNTFCVPGVDGPAEEKEPVIYCLADRYWWRAIFGLQILPALMSVLGILALFPFDTPYNLLNRGQVMAAFEVLGLMRVPGFHFQTLEEELPFPEELPPQPVQPVTREVAPPRELGHLPMAMLADVDRPQAGLPAALALSTSQSSPCLSSANDRTPLCARAMVPSRFPPSARLMAALREEQSPLPPSLASPTHPPSNGPSTLNELAMIQNIEDELLQIWAALQHQRRKFGHQVAAKNTEPRESGSQLVLPFLLATESGSPERPASEETYNNVRLLLSGLTLTILQQLGGINAVTSHCVQVILKSMPPSENSARTSALLSVMIAVLNVMASGLTPRIFDLRGRKWLLTVGFLIQGIAMSFVWFLPLKISLILSPAVVILAFSMTTGPVIWVFLSERYPISIRGFALSSCGMANWLTAVVVVFCFRFSSTTGAYHFFAVTNIAGAVFSYFCLKETKGIPLDR